MKILKQKTVVCLQDFMRDVTCIRQNSFSLLSKQRRIKCTYFVWWLTDEWTVGYTETIYNKIRVLQLQMQKYHYF